MRMSKALLCFVFLVLVVGCERLGAQFPAENYVPLRNYSLSPDELKHIDLAYDSIAKGISYDNKKAKKLIQQSIKESKDEFHDMNTDARIMHQDTISLYLQHIANRVVERNPGLVRRKPTIFCYRTSVPNASDRADGVIFVNLDLIAKLHNEEEMAFVICHEMGHDIKGHVIVRIQKLAGLLADPVMSAKLQEIKHRKYNRYKALEALLSDFLKQFTEHSRTHELQADSLGLVLFMNAGYKASQGLRTIQLLDSVDQPTYKLPIDF
ncbi:MAG TPA: M48 family metallopeptidase, partial [Bacteroidia bacterium]|nr:M48 family metallopeptidase [Bacteroidia bacterium]